MEILQKTALVFTIIGAITWGVVGLFDFNVVDYLLGGMDMLAKAAYVIIGISGLINIGILFNHIER